MVPWKYDATIYVGGKEIQFSDTETFNIEGTSGMTQSSRVFAPNYTPKAIQEPMVIPTPPPHAGTSVFVPTIPVETPSSFISNGTSSSST